MRGDIALDVGAVADDDLYGLDVADHAAEDLCRAFTNDIAGDEPGPSVETVSVGFFATVVPSLRLPLAAVPLRPFLSSAAFA